MRNKTLIAINTQAAKAETTGIIDACKALGSYVGEISAISVFKDSLNHYTNLDFTPLVEYSRHSNEEAMTQQQLALVDIVNAHFPDARCEIAIGIPALEITAKAAHLSSDLIIMGTRGRHGIGRLVGSTSHGVFANHVCDLLAARGSTRGEGYNQVLIAVDTSTMAGTMLQKSKALGFTPEQCSIISVAPPLGSTAAVSPSRALAKSSPQHLQSLVAEQVRENLCKTLIEHDMMQANLTVPIGNAAECIVSKAKEIGADLIIIGSNDRSALNRVLLGSTTVSVLNNATCDVFVVTNNEN